MTPFIALSSPESEPESASHSRSYSHFPPRLRVSTTQQIAYLDLGIWYLHETPHVHFVFILGLDDNLLIGGMLQGQFLGRIGNAGDEFEFVFELGNGPGRGDATLGADRGRGDADWYIACGFHSAMQSSQ